MIKNSDIQLEWPYPLKYQSEKEYRCDILVLGGGVAGCWAAISAAQRWTPTRSGTSMPTGSCRSTRMSRSNTCWFVSQHSSRTSCEAVFSCRDPQQRSGPANADRH